MQPLLWESSTGDGALAADWRFVLAAGIYGIVAAAVLALVIMVKKGVVRRTFSRIFGMALAAAARAKGPDLADSPRVPFAAGIAAGVVLAIAERLSGGWG